MDTSSAVPNDPATWLMVFEVLWAWRMASLGSEFTPQVFSGVMVNWMPTAMTAYVMETITSGESTRSSTKPTAATKITAAPTSTGLRTPWRSKIRPAKKPTTAPMTAPGRRVRPLIVADSPSTPWM